MRHGGCSCLGKLRTGHSLTLSDWRAVKVVAGYNIKVAVFGAPRFLACLSWRGY